MVMHSASPVHVSSDYYYRIPTRTILKTYPVYRPDREPPGYFNWLKRQEPQVAFDAHELKTKSDWVKAGEIVFDAPIGLDTSMFITMADVKNSAWYEKLGVPVAKDGTVPFVRYMVRQKGMVELGVGSCATCHTRVMPDGTVITGAQGNLPYDRVAAYALRRRADEASDAKLFLEQVRRERRLALGVPWIRPDPLGDLDQMSIDGIASAHEAVPPGVAVRVNTSLYYPPAIPSLIGIQDIRYLDHTGLVRQRTIADLMRYAALVQGAVRYDRYLDFKILDPLPDPATQLRYSDDQLYALALYLYSLKPPPNPNRFDAMAARGKEVFNREHCGLCHTPPLYTNNKLTPVEGFAPPKDDLLQFDIFPVSVGTDPGLALKTREGTGYYKVPSLRGVWYRGPFEHSGSIATLEDWFDPRRLQKDYVPTGFRGQGTKRRAIRGHTFGLDLSEEDRKALIKFLKTL
ncbi:MAG TPA: hypothetical protein VG028_19420 [Terriglobia bacterium]|nr:hypothetical protein [Terriglobia bacterium]